MFRIRQYIKMLLQNVCLPMLYHFWARRPVQKGKILMADAHHTMMPFFYAGRMYETLKKEGKNRSCLWRISGHLVCAMLLLPCAF